MPTQYYLKTKGNCKVNLQKLVWKRIGKRRKYLTLTNKHTHITSKEETPKVSLILVFIAGHEP